MGNPVPLMHAAASYYLIFNRASRA